MLLLGCLAGCSTTPQNSQEQGNPVISVKFKFADELRKIAEYIEINTTEDTTVAG